MKTIKFLVLLLVCQFIYSEATAQRIKQERANFSYNQLPTEPLPADFTTYSISINSIDQALTTANLTEKELTDKLTLRAFKKLPKGGHFHINAAVNSLVKLSTEIKSETSSRKNKEGKVIKTTSYYKVVNYRVPVTFTMEDKDGNVLEQQVFGSSAEPLVYRFVKSQYTKFNSKAELNKAWSSKGASTYNTLQKEVIEKAFTTFSKQIKRKYDTTKKSVSLAIMTPAGKKVAAADEFKATTITAEKIIESIKPQVAIDGAKKDLQPMIDFWMAQKDNFSADNKKEIKVHHACLYNLAVAYLVTENLEEATKYIDLAVATKKSKSNTNSLSVLIKDQHKMMKQHEATTLFFPIDLSTAVAPEGVTYEKFAPKPAAKPVDRTAKYEGYFIRGRDTLNGVYHFRNGLSENLNFYRKGDVKFTHNHKKGKKELSVTSDDFFNGGSFNGRTFTVIKRNPEMTIKKALFAVEVLEEGPKMTLLRAFPMEKKKDGSTIKNQTLLKVEGENKYHNLSNTGNPHFLNWKKGFGNFFKGCEVLYAEIRVGEYDRDTDDIIEAIRLYNQNSCD